METSEETAERLEREFEEEENDPLGEIKHRIKSLEMKVDVLHKAHLRAQQEKTRIDKAAGLEKVEVFLRRKFADSPILMIVLVASLVVGAMLAIS